MAKRCRELCQSKSEVTLVRRLSSSTFCLSHDTGNSELAMGIENNNDWNFRDLAGMRENIKSLKKNTGELEGILIGPLRAPRFFSATEIPSWWVFRPLP